LMANAAFLVR